MFVPMLDVVSAFYSMVRELVIRMPSSKEDRAELLGTMAIPEWLVPSLKTALAAPPPILEGR
eukprot:1441833-Pyramimonas_sp.AAC.1